MKWHERGSDAGFPVPMTSRRFAIVVPILAMLFAWLAVLVVSLIAYEETRETMVEVRLAEASAVGGKVRDDLDRALGYGIPMRAIPGVSEYLSIRLLDSPRLDLFLILDEENEIVFHSGIDTERARQLVAQFLIMQPRLHDQEARELAPYWLVPLVLEGGGRVLVGIVATTVIRPFGQEFARMWSFWLGIALLALAWGALSARSSLLEPLARLRIAMVAVCEGRFGFLLERRSRDGMGRIMLQFNALVHGLHARQRALVAHAEDVRHAVFDPRVAEAVTEARDRALVDLGAGFAHEPKPFWDPRSSDLDLFAVTLIASGALAVGGVLHVAPMWAEFTDIARGLGVLVAVVIGVLWGRALPWSRALGWIVAGLLAVLIGFEHGAAFLAPVGWQAVWAGAFGLGFGWGVAIRQRRLARAAGGLGAGLWVLAVGSLAGLGLAWGIQGDSSHWRLGALGLLLVAASLAPRSSTVSKEPSSCC